MQTREIEYHDSTTLFRIHKLAVLIFQAKPQTYTILYTPLQHIHDKLQKDKMVTFDERYKHNSLDYAKLANELVDFWTDFWLEHQIAPYNFQLFLQPDGRVAMTHFQQFGFHQWNQMDTPDQWIAIPKAKVPYQAFFSNPFFPKDFYTRIRHVKGVSPVFDVSLDDE